jgi:hypothetical protein
MTVLSVLDAAGRRRSPATLPGYYAQPPTAQQGHAHLPTRRPWRRSWRSCVTPPVTVTAGAYER